MPIVPAGAQVCVEFKAGRLVREGSLVKPDTRKGLLRVIKTEDGLTHVEWYGRRDDESTATPEYDEIVFPDEAHFEKPAKAPARVYMLKFKEQSDRDIMFWMQEPSESEDEELCRKVDRAINTPMGVDLEDLLEPPQSTVPAGRVPSTDALLRGALSNAPNAGAEFAAGGSMGLLPQGPGQQPQQMAPADLAALLSGMTGAPPGPTAGTGGGSSADPGASLAAALLAAMAHRQQQQRAAAMAMAPGPGLTEVLRPEVLTPLLQDPEVLERLSAYLPEEQRSRESLITLARSPQFQQQLATFSSALQTGQLDLAQFGLNAGGFTVADFLRAIQDLVDRERQQQH
eukprot:GHRR01009524.1.p2 GENE.GHRR01009524.1~~GHRR01009524.1.p2  ORF type:complete len:343 (+),score=129.10 GHRR01009524.1:333-1361(+)